MAKRVRTKKRRNASVGGAADALPALSSLTELPEFGELAASDGQRAAFERFVAEKSAREGASHELSLGCVVRLDRGFPAVLTKDAVFRAEFATRLTKGDYSRVAIGDWVAVRSPEGHDKGLIECILPRVSDISRWRGGNRGECQTLAANVNTVIIVQALEEWRLSAGRVARSAVVARDCGARFAVVLTKADMVGATVVSEAVAMLREVLGDKVSVVVMSSLEKDSQQDKIVSAARKAGAFWGVESVRALVPQGQVGILLGPSGVGKSTLLNALVGHELLETGSVRASDGAGRHTTVARRMVAIPDAGVMVDEPGLRTLQLVGHERGLALVFPDIAQAATECKFRDCTHTHEPGCMVQQRFGNAGAKQGSAGESMRLSTYLSLAAEMRASARTLDPDVVL